MAFVTISGCFDKSLAAADCRQNVTISLHCQAARCAGAATPLAFRLICKCCMVWLLAGRLAPWAPRLVKVGGFHPAASGAHVDARIDANQAVGVGNTVRVYGTRDVFDMHEAGSTQQRHAGFYPMTFQACVFLYFVKTDVCHVRIIASPSDEQKI